MNGKRNGLARLAAIAVAALAMSGCYTVSYQTNATPGGPRLEDHANYFFWGLVGDKTVNLAQMCPQGVARWYNQATFVDGLLSAITLGLYAPRTIVVECAGARASWKLGV